MVVDSKQEQLKFEDIIKIAVKETKSKYPFHVAFVAIIKELTLPGAFPVRFGNTVFIVHPDKKKSHHVFFRALNADTAKNYIDNSRRFTHQMAKKGYTMMVTQFKDPTLLNIFKVIGREQPKDMGYKVQKTEDGGYQVVVSLSKERK